MTIKNGTTLIELYPFSIHFNHGLPKNKQLHQMCQLISHFQYSPGQKVRRRLQTPSSSPFQIIEVGEDYSLFFYYFRPNHVKFTIISYLPIEKPIKGNQRVINPKI